MAEDVLLQIGPPPVAPSDDGEPDVYGPGPDLPPAEPIDLAPEVGEAVVRGALSTLGAVLAASPLAEASIEGHWRFTRQELDDLTPPLTRIINARPQARAAFAHGDELIVAVQLAGFVGRNHLAGAEVRRARAEEYFPDGDVDREAGSPSPAAGGPARGPGDDLGGWTPPPPGTGVAPPAV